MRILISIFYFFYFSSIASFIVYFPSILKKAHFSILQIGIIFSIVPLIRFIIPFFFIKTLNLNSKIININILLNLISCLLYYQSLNSFIFVILVTILYGISFTQFLPYIETIAIKYFNQEEYGKIRLYGSIGFISTTLLVPLYEDIYLFSMHIILVSSIIMYLSIIFLHFFLKKEIIVNTMLKIEKFPIFKLWPFWLSIF